MSMFESEDRVCGSCGKTWDALSFWDAEMKCHECNVVDYTARLAEINAGRPYRVDSIGGACPTQAEGWWVDGKKFYFRARHGDYELRVHPTNAVSGDVIASGDDPTGGWMESADVLAILDRAAAGA